MKTDMPVEVESIDTPAPDYQESDEDDQADTQVDVNVDPKVVKIPTETNMIAIANVSNRNDELKESGNSLNKSVLKLNIAEQVALLSGSNLESIQINQIKPALNDYGS